MKPRQVIFIACLLTFLIYATSSTTIPTVSGTAEAIPEKALSILHNAVGIDNQKYTANQHPINDSKYFDATQKNVDFYLTAPDSKCRVVTSYVNDQLHKIYFSDYEGNISLKYKENNAINIARGFLGRLQNQTKDSLYAQLVASLQDINPDQNITKSVGSMQLKFQNIDYKTIRYRWTYVDSNGVPAERKNIVLNYEEGQLKSYTNNWQLFEVKGKPSLSEKQALEIAIDASKNFSYNITNEKGENETIFGPFALADTSLARTSLGYINLNNQKDARGGNPFDLYPAWYVTLGFSQFYPGDVSGMTVLIWADTGEVRATHEFVTNSQIGRLTDTTSTAHLNSLQVYDQTSTGMVMITLLCVAGLLFGVRIVNKKTIALDRRLTVKPRTIFTISIALVMGVSMVIPLGDAIVPDSMSRIYTFENPSAGSGFRNVTINVAEGAANGEVADYVNESFVNHGGYFTDVNRGSDFTKSSVTSYIASDEANYDRTAILVISHFRNRGRAFLPNSGNESERIWITKFILMPQKNISLLSYGSAIKQKIENTQMEKCGLITWVTTGTKGRGLTW